jgi:metallophosphoesterase superfamily enzyme
MSCNIEEPTALGHVHPMVVVPYKQKFALAGVAWLKEYFHLELRQAMLVVPACFLLSGLSFYVAEGVMKSEQDKARAAVRAAVAKAQE